MSVLISRLLLYASFRGLRTYRAKVKSTAINVIALPVLCQLSHSAAGHRTLERAIDRYKSSDSRPEFQKLDLECKVTCQLSRTAFASPS